MSFTDFLKRQLSDFVDSYKKLYVRSLNITIVYTLVTFVIIAILMHFSDLDKTAYSRQTSLVSYLFYRVSFRSYEPVDLSKTVFLLMVSIYSISQVRLLQRDDLEQNKTGNYFRMLRPEDLTYLVTATAVSVVTDYLLVLADTAIAGHESSRPFYYYWFSEILYQLRIYIPLISFAVANYVALKRVRVKMTSRQVLWLFISLWLFNVFAFELFVFARNHVFQLIEMLFSQDQNFFIETVLGVPFVSFLFVGYHSAMTGTMILLNDEPIIIVDSVIE